MKRRADGTLDFVSPLRCPYNYGAALAYEGGDGDPLDVVLLGARRPAGVTVEAPVVGVVRFMDAGHEDHKVLCGAGLDASTTRGLIKFFRRYAFAKRVLNRARSLPGQTAFLGVFPRREDAHEGDG